MKKNIGETEGVIRAFIALGFALIAVIFMKVLSLAAIIALYVIAIIVVLTAITGFCPLYALFGINTCGVQR